MTPCDQPSIIHSGTRANALHIAANNGNVAMAEVILDLITSPDLVERMYPNETPENRAKRQEYLLDLYLNMPKKGDFDTPLHQASKWGHWPVIQLLVQYSSCDTTRLNRQDKTPADEACSRISPVDQDVKKKIQELLEDRVYIPVFRSEDHSVPGFIGDTLSPSDSNIESINVPTSSPSSTSRNHLNAPVMSPKGNRNMLSPFRNVNSTHCDSPMITVKNLNSNLPFSDKNSPVTSPITIKALMGPLSPADAEKIRQEWKKASPTVKLIRLTDPDKGILNVF